MGHKNPTELDHTTTVVKTAQVLGWLVHHTRPARTATGWRTPVQGDAGFPDLVMVKNGVLVVAELKSPRGKVSPSQSRWLDAFRATAARTFLFVVPDDWAEIKAVLRSV